MPAPPSNPLTRAKVEFARKLFLDTRLSRDGTLSCAICHDPKLSFSDGRPLTQGIGGIQGTRNSPSLINRGYGNTFFWNGRVQALEQLAIEPIVNPKELGNTRAELERRTGVPITEIAAALASYIRTIRSANSRFDRYTQDRARP
jgi:cytochrome c peroxidase